MRKPRTTYATRSTATTVTLAAAPTDHTLVSLLPREGAPPPRMPPSPAGGGLGPHPLRCGPNQSRHYQSPPTHTTPTIAQLPRNPMGGSTALALGKGAFDEECAGHSSD